MVMEHTELVEKYVSGEITDDAFTAEYDKLDEPTKKVVTEELKAAKPKILSEISGLRKEREKVREQKVEAEKPPEDFIKKFRGEQVEKAMKRFFTDRNVDEAEQATIRANFAKLDDGAIDADNIVENVKRVYAYSFPDKVFTVKKEAGEEGAANFNSQQVGAAGRIGSPPELKEDDPRIAQILAEARKEGISMTAEEAKRGLEAGMKRGSNWGGLKPLPKQ
jgi:hypothetical protein